MLDLVYPIPFQGEYEELRYSLRSMCAHVPHYDVWLIGQPDAADFDNVHKINIPVTHSRWTNTSDALLAAIENPDVSDPFIYMNDDFMALTDAPRFDWDKGDLRDHLVDYRQNNQYRNAAVAALHLLNDLGYDAPKSFELHIPMIVDKATMKVAITLLRKLGISEAWKRTVCGTIADKPTVSRPDVKVGLGGFVADDWVSTSDGSFSTGKVGKLIRELYPDPCVYEASHSEAGWVADVLPQSLLIATEA